MKKMKRFLVALLSCVTAIACVAGLAACNNDNDQSTSSSSPAASSSQIADNSSSSSEAGDSSSITEDSSSSEAPAPCEHSGGTATCTAQAICEQCGEPYGNLAPHDWSEELTVAVAANCTNSGTKAHYACENCDAASLDGETVATAEDLAIPADEDSAAAFHANVANLTHVLGKNATCEEAGWTEYYYCPVCDPDGESYVEVEKESDDLVGNDWGWDETITIVREEIPALGHNYVSLYDYMYRMVGGTYPCEAAFRDDWIEVFGYYSPDGYYCEFGPICTHCENIKPGIGHKAAEGKEATCHTLAECEHCGREFGEVDVTNHDWTGAETAVEHAAADCFNDEIYQVVKCPHCDYYKIVKGENDYEVINAADFAQAMADLETKTGKFVNEGSKINHVGHLTAATCTEDASCNLCGKAGAELGENVEYIAHGHAFLPENVVNEVAAYCDKDGVKEHFTCSHCGAVSLTANSQIVASDEDLVIPAHHTWEFVAPTAPDCIHDGTLAHYTCTGTKEDGSACTCVGMGADIDNAVAVNPDEIVDPATGLHVCSNPGDYCSPMAPCDYCHEYVVVNPTPAEHTWEAAENGAVKCHNCATVFNYLAWESGDYYVGDAKSLQHIATIVNNGNPMIGVTIHLLADVDLEKYGEFTPIGYIAPSDDLDDRHFGGNFDGHGHTIKNLKINKPTQWGVGLFGLVAYENVTIKNVTIENANVVGYGKVGVLVGAYWNLEDSKIEISNCAIKTATVTCKDAAEEEGDKAGAIIGYITAGTISECSAENVKISANRDAGQLVGCAQMASVTLTDNTIEEVEVTHNQYGTGANIANEAIGRKEE